MPKPPREFAAADRVSSAFAGELGAIIRRERKARRLNGRPWSQDVLAEHARVERATIVRAEQGETGISLQVWVRILRALGYELGVARSE